MPEATEPNHEDFNNFCILPGSLEVCFLQFDIATKNKRESIQRVTLTFPFIVKTIFIPQQLSHSLKAHLNLVSGSKPPAPVAGEDLIY